MSSPNAYAAAPCATSCKIIDTKSTTNDIISVFIGKLDIPVNIFLNKYKITITKIAILIPEFEEFACLNSL